MAEVLAGFVCGYGLALVLTPIAAMAIVRERARRALMRRVEPTGSPMVAVSVVLHAFAVLALTAVGLLLGALLMTLEDRRPAGGLGSPNGVFTSFVLISGAIAVTPLAIALPRWRALLLVSGLAYILCFGWIMPYLSLLGHDG